MSRITLAHGGGGRLQNELIRNEIASRFANDMLAALPDGALTPEGLVISSDSFVITPRFFPGGDIGKLAVIGTVNDILMAGGIPKYLTCSLILEEGLELSELQRILDSMAQTAKACNVQIVTGDTKVVAKGSGDGVYINTAGVGFKRPKLNLSKNSITPGDRIIVSRSIGEHGLCILSQRYNLNCNTLKSDCACLTECVETLIGHSSAGKKLKFMRDATRGGVLGIISEIFEKSPCCAKVYTDALPIDKEAASVAKLLGIDPGFSACEGCLIAVVAPECADDCLNALHELPAHANAAVIGEVTAGDGSVLLVNSWGAERKLIVPAGDQLPRIC